jgi:hypothetical protein
MLALVGTVMSRSPSGNVLLRDGDGVLGTHRPHRALRLRPPRPTSPVPEPVHGRIRRRPILGGLLNEYEAAA